MSAASATMPRAASAERAWRRPALTLVATFAALYGLGLVCGLVAISLVRDPLTEGSSYYVEVARNLVSGRGLVIDAIWSYATPPLTLPRPAFELWQPVASFVAAAPMAWLGATFNAAQIAFVALGATLAPLAWLVARDTTKRLNLDARRSMTIELGAAVLTAVSAPILLSTAAPDSTLPFTVLAVVAALLMPRAASAEAGSRAAVAALGVTLGLAYLTRMEAVWLGLAFVAGSLLAGRSVRSTVTTAVAVAAIAALVALPWWARNLSVFGTPLPGQVTDNMFLTRNEQIFAYLDAPSLGRFLAQGAPTILFNIGAAIRHNAVDVLLVGGGPVALIGVMTLAASMLRRHRLPTNGPLGYLLLAGAITFVVTSVLFPVATLWGTFEHAAGPLHVALIVAAVVGMDAFVARVRAWRSWPRSNSWLAPAALTLATLPICGLVLFGAARAAHTDAARIQGFVGVLPTDPGPIVTDRPIWLSRALGRKALALPDEGLQAIEQLVADFHAVAIIVTEPRNEFPAALRTQEAQACFGEVVGPAVPAGSAVFVPRIACR